MERIAKGYRPGIVMVFFHLSLPRTAEAGFMVLVHDWPHRSQDSQQGTCIWNILYMDMEKLGKL